MELKLVVGEASPELIIALVVTTSLLVAITMIVKTVTCSIVPFLESVVDVLDVSRSPHEEMITLINVTWLMSSVVSPFLFIADMIIMIWIKFKHVTIEAAYYATAILTPLLITILIFGLIYYRQTIKPREQELTGEDPILEISYKSQPDAESDLLKSTNKASISDSEQSGNTSVEVETESDSSILLSSESYYNYNSESTILVNQSKRFNIYGATLTSDPMAYFGF